MKRRTPALRGVVAVPGDKSISHRALILSALAEGRSEVWGLNLGEDVAATAAALRLLGATCAVFREDSHAVVEGYGRDLREPETVIDCGNSGTTARLLLGMCAAQPEVYSTFTGDGSLRARPMLRVVAPLRQMGARIDGRAHGDRLPLHVRGAQLTGVSLELPVASAQVKSALMLAGLRADGPTSVTEPVASRDHTERMLAARGVRLTVEGRTTRVVPAAVAPLDMRVPGDVSSALFLVVGALIVPGSEVVLENVGLNPTRTAALEALRRMGADLETTIEGEDGGEPFGTLRVRHSSLTATEIGGEEIPALIDEIPVLCVAATQAEGTTVIRDAGELRVKESDRIAAMGRGLRQLGARVEELPDGLAIDGPASLSGGSVSAADDHRIALSLAVAGLAARGNVRVEGWSSTRTSFPEFLDLLGRLTR